MDGLHQLFLSNAKAPPSFARKLSPPHLGSGFPPKPGLSLFKPPDTIQFLPALISNAWSTLFWGCSEGINWVLCFGSPVGRNLILHTENHQEMARSHRNAPAPFQRGPSGPENHAPAISPSLRVKGRSRVKQMANGDPPPVTAVSTVSQRMTARTAQWVLVPSSNTVVPAAAGDRDSLERP